MEGETMPQVEIDEATDGYLDFAAGVAGLTKGQVVARLVEQARAASQAQATPAKDGAEPAPVRIHADYAGQRTQAFFVPGPGRIEIVSGPLSGQVFRTPSEAARAIVMDARPDVSPARNGWTFFLVTATGQPLQTLRHRPV
ncbi:hypothetical protein [Polymorphospora rubra]|uniref:hypothetical protein n=1 Tax=Polymorphospora rubra TaxID=338584 RepID=UPI0033F40B67